MKLATIRTTDGTACVRVDTATATETGYADLGALLSEPGWREIAEAADGPVHAVADLDYAPVVPRPGKVVCVGLNYRNHIQEMGREIPQYPTLFTKFPEALVGAHDDIVLPAVSDAVDWEAELAVVIGTTVRHADQEAATAAIAGYSILNDVTIRDWQYRTTQWHQGKSFEATTPSARSWSPRTRWTPEPACGWPGRWTGRPSSRPTPPTWSSTRRRWSPTSPRWSPCAPAT